MKDPYKGVLANRIRRICKLKAKLVNAECLDKPELSRILKKLEGKKKA